MQTELEQIERQTQLLTDRETAIQRQLLAKVRGVPVETLHDHYRYGRNDPEVQQTIERRSTVDEDELLAENEVGRQVVKLRSDEASVLDAVWLATSPKQLKTLWKKSASFWAKSTRG